MPGALEDEDGDVLGEADVHLFGLLLIERAQAVVEFGVDIEGASGLERRARASRGTDASERVFDRRLVGAGDSKKRYQA